MTILLVVTGFSLVLVYNNLLTSTLLHNGCGNSCVSNVSTNLEGIVTYCDHLVKSNSVTSFCIDLLNLDHITFRNFELISTCCNNCVHNKAPPIIYSLTLVVKDSKIRYTYT